MHILKLALAGALLGTLSGCQVLTLVRHNLSYEAPAPVAISVASQRLITVRNEPALEVTLHSAHNLRQLETSPDLNGKPRELKDFRLLCHFDGSVPSDEVKATPYLSVFQVQLDDPLNPVVQINRFNFNQTIDDQSRSVPRPALLALLAQTPQARCVLFHPGFAFAWPNYYSQPFTLDLSLLSQALAPQPAEPKGAR